MTAPRADAALGLVVHTRIPESCRLHPVPDDAHAPHLRTGDWAVVDVTDKHVEWGGLYLVEQHNGPRLWQVNPVPYAMAVQFPEPCAYLTAMNGPTSGADADRKLRTGAAVFVSDGPLDLSALERRIIGRVVGVYMAGIPSTPRTAIPAPPRAA